MSCKKLGETTQRPVGAAREDKLRLWGKGPIEMHPAETERLISK